MNKILLLYLQFLFLVSTAAYGAQYRVSDLTGEVIIHREEQGSRAARSDEILHDGDTIRTKRDSTLALQKEGQIYRIFPYSLIVLQDEPELIWGKMSSSPEGQFIDVRFYFYPRPAQGRVLKVGLRAQSEDLSLSSSIRSGTGYRKEISFHKIGEGTYRAITGFDVELAADKYWLEIRAWEGASVTRIVYPFYLKASQYGGGNVYIATGKGSLFSPSKKKEEEIEQLKTVLSVRSERAMWEGCFSYPVEEPDIISGFGKKRVYYIEKKRAMTRYHRGVDFKGETGDPVLSPAGGVVVFASERITTGNTLVIDHGQGVFSLFFHLDGISVPLGTTVTKGMVVAEIGATGITEGSHLHWGVLADGIYVDPIDWIRFKF